MAFNPLSIITGGLGAALPLVAGKMGVGKNTTNVTDFGRTSQYNPNAYQYGGREGAADETAGRFANLAAGAQDRQTAQAANVGVNYSQANQYAGQGQQARAGQNDLASMMYARANGATPSIAQMQADRQMQQAGAAQASASASARGAGAMALAQQNAAGNVATMQSAISNQAQQNAAQERMQAEQNAYGAYSGMRGGDQAGEAQAAQQAQYAAQIQAQQNQYNAQLQAQQRAQNDQYSMGLYGQENNVRQMQLTGGMNNQAMLGQTFMQGQGQRIGVGQANANLEDQRYQEFGKGLTGMMGGATAGMGGGGAAGGGPVPQASATGMGSAGGAQSSMVGIPQAGSPMPPPTGSDDRMKFGMSPLSFLGMGGGGGGFGDAPGAGVDMGGKGYMSQGDVQAASSGLAGGGGGMPGMVGGGGVTGGNMGDLGMPGGGGGMGGGLLSDDHAKLRAVYLQGLADSHGDERAYPGLGSNEQLIVGRNGARIQSGLAGLRTSGSASYRDAGLDSEAAARADEGDAPALNAAGFLSGVGPIPSGVSSASGLINRGRAAVERSQDVRGQGRVVTRDAPYGVADGSNYAQSQPDPVTEQFARGLAPIRYEYRPGMGPAGRQTGVRAQQAETQPVTASMITRRPDGLRQIDPAMGLGTALAGVGHLAQRQQQQDERLNGLLAMAARREGY